MKHKVCTEENSAIVRAGGKLMEGIHSVTQDCVNHATQSGASGPDVTYLSIMGTIGSLMVLSICCSKKPEPNEVEEKDGMMALENDVVSKMVTSESKVYAALLAANSLREIHPGGGVCTDLGPDALYEALEQWKAIYPEKDPTKYLDAGMIKAAEAAGRESTKPFDDLLAARKALAAPSSGTLQ